MLPPDMAIAVDWDIKNQFKETNKNFLSIAMTWVRRCDLCLHKIKGIV